jgi:hypothetical protein
MGYNARITKSTVVIPASRLDVTLQRWKGLNRQENNHLKQGGSYHGGKQRVWWFSWMDEDYDTKVQSVADVLDMLGFDYVSYTADGSVEITGYDSKMGQEELFFATIASGIPEGQYINWIGEDGHTWQWLFTGGQLVKKNGQVVF